MSQLKSQIIRYWHSLVTSLPPNSPKQSFGSQRRLFPGLYTQAEPTLKFKRLRKKKSGFKFKELLLCSLLHLQQEIHFKARFQNTGCALAGHRLHKHNTETKRRIYHICRNGLSRRNPAHSAFPSELQYKQNFQKQRKKWWQILLLGNLANRGWHLSNNFVSKEL